MTFRAFLKQRWLSGAFPVIATRVLWQMLPDVWTCGVFWLMVLVLPFFRPKPVGCAAPTPRWQVPWLLLAFVAVFGGSLMNALVTLANGGFMPVSGAAAKHVGASLWVVSAHAHKLTVLGDNYAGFSLGDMGIGVGLLCMLAISLVSKATGSDATAPMKTWHQRLIAAAQVFSGFMAVTQSLHARTNFLASSFAVLAALGLYLAYLHMEWKDQEQRRVAVERRRQFELDLAKWYEIESAGSSTR